MSAYLSHASLSSWVDRRTLAEGRRLFELGRVVECELDPDMIRATVYIQGRPVLTRFRITDKGDVESHCPCKATQERGMICIHVIATGFWVADATEDPVVERHKRIAHRKEQEAHLDGYIRRLPLGSEGGVPAQLRLRLTDQWTEEWRQGEVALTCQALYRDRKSRLDKISPEVPLCFDEQDAHMLYVLEDMAESPTTPGSLRLSHDLFIQLLQEWAPRDLAILNEERPLEVRNDAHTPLIHVRLIPASGELKIEHVLDADVDGFLLGKKSGWILSGNTLRPLEAVLPDSIRDAYTTKGAIIPRHRVLSFLANDLPGLEEKVLVESHVAETDFELRDTTPEFEVELLGTLERLEIRCSAIYGDHRTRIDRVFGSASDVYPVPGEPLAFFRRNCAAEKDALRQLQERVELFVEGAEHVMHMLADTVPALRSEGWRVAVSGLLENVAEQVGWIRPVVSISAGKQDGWFDVAVSYTDDRGRPLDCESVEDVLGRKNPMLETDGRALLVSTPVAQALDMLHGECATTDDRVSDVHAGSLSHTLNANAEITLEADEAWHKRAKQQTEKIDLEPVAVDESLQKVLRPYQQEGINWLRFLERGRYCGILADEMGLGKTLQALAWIQLERISDSAKGLPSLVVCPTSLVDNWAREAERFTPALSCLVIHGPDRHVCWDALSGHDVLITSYALLRRDIARYQDQQFAVVVLDEAQHIKNRSTQNAQGAKKINAVHRLVLTGTPMENSVADLWSIMDFLMPRYLGSHALFRESYERPIAKGGKAADDALRTLRYKIEPFMLRRLKQDVAKDLPEKVTRIATCALSDEQAARYSVLAEQYHDDLSAMIDEKGFARSRFTVLKTLLRLRQLCCHPALLKEEDSDHTVSSGKLDLFFELLAEAMDGGNRVLVFSQFVEMLHILRHHLDKRSIPFAYLDGSTKKRQEEIDRFNESPDIPVFLVSLKAGGTGLNLTGANVVIHYDPWWNPAVEDQATDRVHRIGQTRSVYSIKLITQGTIEEKVLALQERKRQLIDATVGGERQLIRSLSWEDVQQLLAL